MKITYEDRERNFKAAMAALGIPEEDWKHVPYSDRQCLELSGGELAPELKAGKHKSDARRVVSAVASAKGLTHDEYVNAAKPLRGKRVSWSRHGKKRFICFAQHPTTSDTILVYEEVGEENRILSKKSVIFNHFDEFPPDPALHEYRFEFEEFSYPKTEEHDTEQHPCPPGWDGAS